MINIQTHKPVGDCTATTKNNETTESETERARERRWVVEKERGDEEC